MLNKLPQIIMSFFIILHRFFLSWSNLRTTDSSIIMPGKWTWEFLYKSICFLGGFGGIGSTQIWPRVTVDLKGNHYTGHCSFHTLLYWGCLFRAEWMTTEYSQTVPVNRLLHYILRGGSVSWHCLEGMADSTPTRANNRPKGWSRGESMGMLESRKSLPSTEQPSNSSWLHSLTFKTWNDSSDIAFIVPGKFIL